MKRPLNANRRMKKLISLGFVVLLLISMATVAMAHLWDTNVDDPNPAQAIWVDPASTVLQICETFTVDVICNITDPPGIATGLFGFEYKLFWNSTILEAKSIQYHSPLPIPPALLIKNETGVWTTGPKAGLGYHWLGITAVFGQTTFTGVTSVCTYTFHVTANANCTLDLQDTEFVDDTATTIISDTIGTVVDGYFSDPYPRATFTYDPLFPLVNETVTFNASDSYDPDGFAIANYSWNFDDGTPIVNETDPITTHNYTAFGVYNVTLTVADIGGLTDIAWHVVKVGTVAAFSYSPEFPLTGQIVTFNATESGAAPPGYIANYTWNFDDGNITIIGDDEPTTPIINHTYANGGIYNVTLIVADNASNTDTELHTVKVGRWPTARFETRVGSPTWGEVKERVPVNEPMLFKDKSEDVYPGYIVNFTWNFGDGNITTIERNLTRPFIDQHGNGWVIHVYTVTGTYTVTLTVTDNETITDSYSREVLVPVAPVADFTWSPEEPKVGEIVTFDGSLSTPDGGSIVVYSWDFGDGTVADEEGTTTEHTYTVAGTYNVILTVSDDEDATGATTKPINIAKASSNISIDASPKPTKVGEDTSISGDIDPDRDGANVTIYYRLAGETWDSLTTVTTNSTGGYSYTWTPDEAGTYEVKASWPGDANTEPAESSVIEIEVKEKPAPLDWLLYVGIAIVIIIAAAIAIYFLKIRKP